MVCTPRKRSTSVTLKASCSEVYYAMVKTVLAAEGAGLGLGQLYSTTRWTRKLASDQIRV